METFGTFKSKKTNEDVRHSIRSRRYEITNTEGIVNVPVANGYRHRNTNGQNGIE